ncbi:MAG: DNA/RNA nuclease SfsA [Archaeoglobus sp.]|nr:DNA/RNA nuclease SfsA [Archaeoglobus sp.]
MEIHGKECEIVKRLNRFVVEIEVEGRIRKAHLNNTGRLQEYLIRGRKAYCIEKEKGKTDYRLFAVEDLGKAALIDTQFQMKAFENALKLDLIPWLKCRDFKRNQRINDSLIDYLFLCPESVYLEVKSAALRQGEYAMYPDCPSLRGRKHISELIKAANNCKTFILFIAAVPGVKAFKPNKEADAVIAELLRKAASQGVEIKAINLIYEADSNSVLLINPDFPVEIL